MSVVETDWVMGILVWLRVLFSESDVAGVLYCEVIDWLCCMQFCLELV